MSEVDLENPSLDEAGIVNLIQKDHSQMGVDELDALIETSQKIAGNAPARRAALGSKKSTNKPKKSSLNLDQFL